MAKTKKNLTRKQKEELLAAMLNALPDSKKQNVEAVAAAMVAGYNLGKQACTAAE